MFVYKEFCHRESEAERKARKDIDEGVTDIHRAYYLNGKKARDDGYAPAYIIKNYSGEERDMMLMGWQYRNWQYDNGEA